MDRWDKDSRRDGGDGWALDDSGEWVSKTQDASGAGGPSARPAASSRRGASRGKTPETPRTETAPASLPEPVLEQEPPEARQGRGWFGTLMVAIVLPAIAAGGVLYVWKGPGRDAALAQAALAQIEPFIVQLAAYRDSSDSLDAAPPAAIEDCSPVHRGMAGSIVFQRSGACDRAR